MNRHAEVGGQGPGSGGPDGDRRVADADLRRRLRGQRELDEDRGAFLVLVFHLGLGQRGVRAVGPLDRLLRLIDRAVLHQLGEDAQDLGLVAGSHGEVGILPIAEDPEAAERAALDVDPALGEFRAAAADLGGLQSGGLLDHLELDRQPVAVPAGDERRLEAGHRLGLHHQVLEHLVERGAHVDVAVGEGRAVVEDEGRRLLGAAALDDFLVKPGLLPNRETLRLVLHEVPAHRERGLRQQQRVFEWGVGTHWRARTLATGPRGVNHRGGD